jgi:hypothetical protein
MWILTAVVAGEDTAGGMRDQQVEAAVAVEIDAVDAHRARVAHVVFGREQAQRGAARGVLGEVAVRVLEEHAQLVARRADDVAASVAVDVAHRDPRVVEVDLGLALRDERARAVWAVVVGARAGRRADRAARPEGASTAVVPRPGTTRRRLVREPPARDLEPVDAALVFGERDRRLGADREIAERGLAAREREQREPVAGATGSARHPALVELGEIVGAEPPGSGALQSGAAGNVRSRRW